MAGPTEDFISGFRSLSGETFALRHKSLGDLLHKTRSSLKDGSQQIDFSSLHPRNYVEEKFKTEALIYFQRVPELFQMLKSENSVQIANVLKVSHLFIDNAFKNISGDQLTKDIFPHLSFVTKLKLLNKLALHLKDAKQVEDFFEEVRLNYGLYLASKLLPGCSGDFIIKTIKSYRIEITPGQLLVIVKKYPELTESIFEAIHSSYGDKNKLALGDKYKKVFAYLMQCDVVLFKKLNDKYHPACSLGRRGSARFISADKQNVLVYSKNIYKLLKKQQIVKSLNQHFKQFFLNSFPASINRFEEDYEQLLALVECCSSEAEKINLMLEGFRTAYGSELLDHSKYVTTTLIEMMTPDFRETWMANTSRPSTISEEAWIAYMKTEKSLPLLKERIALTSNLKLRTSIIPHLVRTCKINKDMGALADVCKYMVTKHHNDNQNLRNAFLQTLMDLDLKKLEEEHWLYINELIQLNLVNNECYGGYSELIRPYIIYRLSKNLSVKDQIEHWVKFKYYHFELKEPKYERQCLLVLGETVGLGYRDDQLSYPHVDYLNYLSCWNEAHPKSKISLLPYKKAIDYFKIALKENELDYAMEKIILQFLQEDITTEEKLELLNEYFATEKYMLGYLLKWLLINQPAYVLDNLHNIAKRLLNQGSPQKLPCVWIVLKRYSYLGIPQKLCTIFQEFLETKQKDIDDRGYFETNEVGVALLALSVLMDTEDFLKLISTYYPSNLNVDLKTVDSRFLCKIQKAVASSVRNVALPSLALESVLHFCKGDYLGYVQKSLYAVSQNVAEDKLPDFLSKLSSRAVSVRKHSIFLTIKILNKSQIYCFLNKFMKDEKNSSIRKSLFKGSFNFFINNPDDRSWELLKENVRQLNEDDNEAFNMLTKFRKVPKAYVVNYILFAWDTLSKLPNSKEREENYCKILEEIAIEVIPNLPKEFYTGIIEDHLFKSDTSSPFQMAVHLFTANCLRYCHKESDAEDLLKVTFGMLKDYIASSWYEPKTCMNGRKTVFNFIKEFCGIFLETKQHTGLFSRFLGLWNNSFGPYECLDEYLYLQLTLIYLESASLFDTGERLKDLYEKLSTITGPSMVDTLKENLKLFTSYYLLNKDDENKAEENRYILIDNLKIDNVPIRMLLAIFLLPDEVPVVPKFKLKYDDVIKILLKEQDAAVQMYMHKYLLQTELAV